MRNTVPDMQRRHFEFIAEAIKTFATDNGTKLCIARHFAGHLSMTNGQFNKDHFIEAATKG